MMTMMVMMRLVISSKTMMMMMIINLIIPRLFSIINGYWVKTWNYLWFHSKKSVSQPNYQNKNLLFILKSIPVDVYSFHSFAQSIFFFFCFLFLKIWFLLISSIVLPGPGFVRQRCSLKIWNWKKIFYISMEKCMFRDLRIRNEIHIMKCKIE